MFVVRPAKESDFEALLRLAKLAGPGFTSLAVGQDALKRRLDKAVKSFDSKTRRTPDHIYLMMLEDTDSGEVIGLSAVKAQIGVKDPFFNFRILNIAQKSAVTDQRFDMEVLLLVNEYADATEVGSLFVDASKRGTGAGRLISQARYMLIAADPNRFGDKIVSELRGHVDDKGNSPFWEAIGRKFFHMDFLDADHISAEKDNQFILDLMPTYPIYAALLPEEAQKVMGQTHPAGVGARRYLEAEGFRYDGVIDIFDGGPSMSAPTTDIRTVKESRIVKAVSGEFSKEAMLLTTLISNDRIADFRVVLQPICFNGDDIIMSEGAFKALKLKSGDSVRIWIKR